MNTNQTYYCKLQYSVDFEYSENLLLRKPRTIETTGYFNAKVYVEEYYNFESLKDRIDNFYNLLVEGYKKQNIDIYSNKCSFREYTVCNRFNDCITVGVSSSGWNISILFFSYLWDYFKANMVKLMASGNIQNWLIVKKSGFIQIIILSRVSLLLVI